MTRFPSRLLATLAAAAVLPLVAACGGAPAAKITATPKPSTSSSSATQKAAKPPRRPKVGACYRLTFAEATKSTSETKPSPCTGPHTAVTIAVGTLDQVVDGHLLAVDAAEVQAGLEETCQPSLAKWVGGDQQSQLLSRFRVIWFSPTLTEAAAGANWYRCDVVAVRTTDTLAGLDGDVRNVLADTAALDRYGLCATGDPAAGNRVICSATHRWRAVTARQYESKVAFGDTKAREAGERDCKDAAEQRATDALDFSYSFEWPTRRTWRAGQRVAYCWVPATGGTDVTG